MLLQQTSGCHPSCESDAVHHARLMRAHVERLEPALEAAQADLAWISDHALVWRMVESDNGIDWDHVYECNLSGEKSLHASIATARAAAKGKSG